MHAASQDLEILERACGVGPRRLVDTQVAAGFVGLGSPGLGVLLQRRLGVHLPKADRLTDWLHRPLSDAARIYAAADVAYLDALWTSLRAELERRGRLDWALDECDQLRRRHGEQLDPDAGLVAHQGGPPPEGPRPRRRPVRGGLAGAAGPPRSTGPSATCCPTSRWWPSPSARPVTAATCGACGGSTGATCAMGPATS